MIIMIVKKVLKITSKLFCNAVSSYIVWTKIHDCRAHQREALNEVSILAKYKCTCLSRSGMSIWAHVHVQDLCVTCSDTRRCLVLAMEDRKNGASWQWRMGRQCGWSSTTYVFYGVGCWTQPMVGGTMKEKAMNSVYSRSQEGTREREKVQRREHIVESLHKPGINYAHFSCSIQP